MAKSAKKRVANTNGVKRVSSDRANTGAENNRLVNHLLVALSSK
jgi:hypothetical protein